MVLQHRLHPSTPPPPDAWKKKNPQMPQQQQKADVQVPHLAGFFAVVVLRSQARMREEQKSSYHPERRLLHPSVYRRLASRSSLGLAPPCVPSFSFLCLSWPWGGGFSLMGDATRCFHKAFLLSRLLSGRESESRLLEVSKTSIPLPVWSCRLSSARCKRSHTRAHQ